MQAKVEKDAYHLYKLLFEPETDQPVKTLDLPLGGSSSPVDALSLIVELLMLADSDPSVVGREQRLASDYHDDASGEETSGILRQCTKIMERITSNTHGSLGLHPAVYFYNERGKHSRFLFLGVVHLINKNIKCNNKAFFRKYTAARSKMEEFLLRNKALLGIVLQNTNKSKRVDRMSMILDYCIREVDDGGTPSVEGALSTIGARGRMVEITAEQRNTPFSEDTKSEIFIKTAIQQALKCPVCSGLIDPSKSMSYDHIVPKREG